MKSFTRGQFLGAAAGAAGVGRAHPPRCSRPPGRPHQCLQLQCIRAGGSDRRNPRPRWRQVLPRRRRTHRPRRGARQLRHLETDPQRPHRRRPSGRRQAHHRAHGEGRPHLVPRRGHLVQQPARLSGRLPRRRIVNSGLHDVTWTLQQPARSRRLHRVRRRHHRHGPERLRARPGDVAAPRSQAPHRTLLTGEPRPPTPPAPTSR